MIVREIKENDFDGLMQLYTQLHDNEIPQKNEHLQALWNKIISDENHHIIVAVENEKIISSCVCIIIPNLTHFQQPYGLVENVVTGEIN